MGQQFSVIYQPIYDHVTGKLLQGLSPRLIYHSINHTLDVLEQVQLIAEREKINHDENLFLLKVAALYHDSGFLFIYAGHEAKGCEIAKEELPLFGLKTLQIDKICGMIMATKIPQAPGNNLEEIICDADLDYLGRNDFEMISNNLFKEFLDFGFVKDYSQWMKLQVKFFESHHYFTNSSQQLRNPVKMARLEKLKSLDLPEPDDK